MNKIAMRVAVLVTSLGLSGAAFAGSESATTANGRPMVAPVADSQAQKSTPEAGKAKLTLADAKTTTEQKNRADAKQQKPEASAKNDAKSVTPAPVTAQENNGKK
ncbi:MAG: hypothetical protein H7836_15840 [Magnetococcus sp. YQC-3]